MSTPAPPGPPDPDRVHVRRATPGDAAALADLNGHVQRLHLAAAPGEFTPFDPAAAQRFFTDAVAGGEALVWLAELGARPVGYLFAREHHREAGPFTTARSTLHVHHLAVDPAVRRRGVASAVLDAAQDHARERGLRGLRLESWTFNEEAHAFFRSRGFAPFLTGFTREL